MARTKKQENQQKKADLGLRQMFSRLTTARQHAGEWKAIADATRDAIVEAAGDVKDVTFIAPDGSEVGSIGESEPRQRIDYKSIFEDAYFQQLISEDPKLAAIVESAKGEFTTTVTVRSKWIEPDPQTRSGIQVIDSSPKKLGR
jgi:hypothetical protein